ncbi:MAG: FAD-binding protein [Flavobacteriia bacterium]|nr:FAD-binding protein [Flavobacteriia bacterium]
MYNKITENDLDFFQQLLKDRCLNDANTKQKYSSDHTEDLFFEPEIVLKPINTLEVSKIMSYCNSHKIPITPSGARTGLSGGMLPVYGGVLLSLEKMNNIIEIDENNLQITTEPGVITQVLQEKVREKGLFYPPDPASKGSCFIGGNIAENSGGPKAVKYGVTKDYVLNLEIVLPNGEIIWTGANVLKNSTGYNLTQLMVGSEGTLGIITKIVLRLIPHPTHDLLMLVPFYEAQKACIAVAEIFKQGITPSGLELMEKEALLYAQEFLKDKSIEVKDTHQAHLLIELDGFKQEQLLEESEKIYQLLEKFDIDEILLAETEAQKNALWKLRRSVGEAVKKNSIYKEEDTVVPRFHLAELLKSVKRIGDKYGFKSICYGHAGDGNLHVNILKGNLTDDFWNNELKNGIRELFKEVHKLGGTISGEHGIGYIQKEFLSIVMPEIQINLMKSIKKVFDPNMILNPGKIFD